MAEKGEAEQHSNRLKYLQRVDQLQHSTEWQQPVPICALYLSSFIRSVVVWCFLLFLCFVVIVSVQSTQQEPDENRRRETQRLAQTRQAPKQTRSQQEQEGRGRASLAASRSARQILSASQHLVGMERLETDPRFSPTYFAAHWQTCTRRIHCQPSAFRLFHGKNPANRARLRQDGA